MGQRGYRGRALVDPQSDPVTQMGHRDPPPATHARARSVEVRRTCALSVSVSG